MPYQTKKGGVCAPHGFLASTACAGIKDPENACTGVKGVEDARLMAESVSKPLGLRRREIGVCSTGVIGLPLPMERITPHGQKQLGEKPSPSEDVPREPG